MLYKPKVKYKTFKEFNPLSHNNNYYIQEILYYISLISNVKPSKNLILINILYISNVNPTFPMSQEIKEY